MACLDWQHLVNGKHGTVFSTSKATPPNTGVDGFSFPPQQTGREQGAQPKRGVLKRVDDHHLGSGLPSHLEQLVRELN
ncbi:hypothetical protein GOPIP_039_01470 [Gordonia polyisoprenivorans NBRC 16320 = JCM 10675]|nr:hypothetical protein GOPIP_039_01470 [Gordonia polyisoprenivorans NBRC 16320 = JCM 10675]